MNILSYGKGISVTSIVLWFVWSCGYAQSPPAEQSSSPKNANGQPSVTFECKDQRAELSREKLEQIAVDTFKRNGGDPDTSRMTIRIISRGCDWQVLVQLADDSPGSFFGVLIDGRSGRVKHYSPGR